MRFVLASASTARRAALRAAGIDPEVMISGVDEDSIRAGSVARLVHALAEVKARAVAARIRGSALVLGCDSLLELDGQGLGKPLDSAIATDRWRRMRGRTAVLHTGHALFAVIDGVVTAEATASVPTELHFANVTDAEIAAYVATGEPLAVAGAFTIDGLGGWFVESVVGDHHNVIGVSLPVLRRLLGELGYSLGDIGYPAQDDA